jgi:hypothetical protein
VLLYYHTFKTQVFSQGSKLTDKGLNVPIYEKIPVGLVEGYGGPRTGNETPVTTAAASDNGALSDQPKRDDHGVSPEKPDPKRRRQGSLQPHRVTAPTK